VVKFRSGKWRSAVDELVLNVVCCAVIINVGIWRWVCNGWKWVQLCVRDRRSHIAIVLCDVIEKVSERV